MAFSDDVKGTRDYIQDAVKAVWGVTSVIPPEIEEGTPFCLIQSQQITFEPLSLASQDMATVVFTVGGRFDKVTNVDDAKIDKIHAARNAILADRHAGGYATRLSVTSADMSDDSTLDDFYEVLLVVEAQICADLP